MLISELGEVLTHHKEIERLDRIIENAKLNKITIVVGGENMSEFLGEACQSTVISQLRALRGVHVRALLQFGVTE